MKKNLKEMRLLLTLPLYLILLLALLVSGCADDEASTSTLSSKALR